jgi:hypothetical protein
MPVHRVQQGECLTTIAARYSAESWRALHDHPDNADLKKARPNPSILLPGDAVVVPEAGEEKFVECASGKLHRFKVKQALGGLRIVLRDAEGTPFGGKKYVITVGGREIEGVTNGEGLVEVDVPLSEEAATLRAWLYDDDDLDDPDIEYELLLGHLDPSTSLSGVHGRLQNLGFRVSPDGQPGDETKRAIQRFRDQHGITPEGEDLLDKTLCAALCAMHEGA